MPISAGSTCSKLGEKKLRQPALHAIIIHCEAKSTRIAPPKTLTDSNTQFMLKAKLYLHSMSQTPKSVPYNITLPKYTLSY